MLRFLSYLGVLIVLASSSFVVHPTVLAASAAGDPDVPAPSIVAPLLSGAAATVPGSSAVTIQGHGFTPSGQVYIAFFDQWGRSVRENRWITASGISDVAGGRGGWFRETFDGLCGTSTMVRAYDQMTAQWSPFLNVSDSWLGCDWKQRPNGVPY